MKTYGAGTEVPESFSLVCFSQPPTPSAVTPGYLHYPAFISGPEFFLVSLTMLAAATESSPPRPHSHTKTHLSGVH